MESKWNRTSQQRCFWNICSFFQLEYTINKLKAKADFCSSWKPAGRLTSNVRASSHNKVSITFLYTGMSVCLPGLRCYPMCESAVAVMGVEFLIVIRNQPRGRPSKVEGVKFFSLPLQCAGFTLLMPWPQLLSWLNEIMLKMFLQLA